MVASVSRGECGPLRGPRRRTSPHAAECPQRPKQVQASEPEKRVAKVSYESRETHVRLGYESGGQEFESLRARQLSIEAPYPMLALIHVFLDNARYHHAKLVQEWLALPGRRIKLHFIPTYCPHLNPIERLWGLMHRNVTHNKCYATCAQFADATLSFLREKVPGNWADLCDSVTDNFRIINPKDFRVMT